MIIGFVKGQQFSKKQPVIVSNSINYLEARFVFQTSDWSELVKFAHFKSGDSVYDFILDGDIIPKEAQLNLYAGNWEVYIHGDRYVVDDDGNEKIVERITTNTQTVQVVKYEQNGNVLPEVGTSVAEQIAAVADNAKKIATSVRNEADAGAFDGKDGYTPVKGVDYFDGNDGVSVTHEWKGTVLEVTSASGTSSADLKGEKGELGTTGPQGADGKSFFSSMINLHGVNVDVQAKDIINAGQKIQYGDLVLSPNGKVYVVRAINGDTVSLHDGGFSLKGPAGSDYNLTNADKTEIAGMAAEMVDGVTVSNVATPGQLLLVKAVDENGNPTEWRTVERTHYEDSGMILDEEVVQFQEMTENGMTAMAAMLDPVTLFNGETYKITWNGIEYSCVWNNGVMGNLSMMGGADTGEPFIITEYIVSSAVDTTVNTLLVDLTGASTATVSIYGKTLKPLDKKYLPSIGSDDLPTIPTYDLTAYGIAPITFDNDCSIDIDEALCKEIIKQSTRGPVCFKIATNLEYSDGTKNVSDVYWFTATTTRPAPLAFEGYAQTWKTLIRVLVLVNTIYLHAYDQSQAFNWQ